MRCLQVPQTLEWLILGIAAIALTVSAAPDEKKYEVYFDETWQPVPLLAVDNTSTIIRRPHRRYGLLPCECEELECGCCVNTNFFSTKRSGCMNVTYVPGDFAIRMNMQWNGESIYEREISAKNPPPACMEAPIPYLPSMQFCIRIFDIFTRGQNIHMCVNFETRIARAPIMILEFDCFQMGMDGVEHVKFNSSTPSSSGAKFTTILPMTTDPTTIDYEDNITTEQNNYINNENNDITTTEQFGNGL